MCVSGVTMKKMIMTLYITLRVCVHIYRYPRLHKLLPVWSTNFFCKTCYVFVCAFTQLLRDLLFFSWESYQENFKQKFISMDYIWMRWRYASFKNYCSARFVWLLCDSCSIYIDTKPSTPSFSRDRIQHGSLLPCFFLYSSCPAWKQWERARRQKRFMRIFFSCRWYFLVCHGAYVIISCEYIFIKG